MPVQPPESPERMSIPCRVNLPDFAGRRLSLPEESQAWEGAGEGECVLLLGLGPGRPWDLPFARERARVFWLDEPQTLRRLEVLRPAERRGSPPGHWREVTPDEAVALATRCACYFYRPGLRLAPEFWGPLLGRMDAARLAANKSEVLPRAEKTPDGNHAVELEHGPGCRGPVILPGTARQLLHEELRQALTTAGFAPVLESVPSWPAWPESPDRPLVPESPDGREASWAGYKPAFLLSVNLRGLDPDGRIFYFCRAMGVPVALWFVDNPWHLLSALRLPWWREAALFVTDAGFIPGLRAAGAKRVVHLPLAVAPQMWRELPNQAGSEGRNGYDLEGGGYEPPLFVGRSAFPERDRFFAAARVPPALLAEAGSLLERPHDAAQRPHFHWWLEKLGITPWPGQDVRRAGLGAELCARANRARWVRAGLAAGLRVVGDAGWRELLPELNPLPPVDYYTELPGLYAGAEAVLNVTSLLLPQSLSQRHFDVWAAGGLLLSDATPGLELFPEELTRPMRLRGPEELAPRLAELRVHPARARELRAAWRAHLRAGHSYEHRVDRICETLEL